MAKPDLQQLTLIISLLIVAIAEAKPTEKYEFVVEGMVYCQSCAARGGWSLAGATPMGNATISVICKDYRNRVIYYKPYNTNKGGYFYAELKGFKVINPYLDHPLQTCKIKLVSSPLQSCNALTNVNYGLAGAALRSLGKRALGRRYQGVVFTAGPLAFRPAYCPPK